MLNRLARWASQHGSRVHLGFGLLFMLVGAPLALGSIVVMNEMSKPPDRREVDRATSIEVVKRTPKPKPKVANPKPKPKPKSKAPPPPSLAALSSGMGGIAFDIPGLAFDDLGGADAALMAGSQDVVHTSDTVDNPPRPSRQEPMEYPRRLRDSGVEGYVTLSLLINETGQIEQVRVVESSPPGAFDDVATTGIRNWRFQAGSYKGEPVKVWVRQTIQFKLRK